ncbi:MAG: NAD(P)/FAD-dependent oxidoreductase [Reichenbachiella sp.]
MKVAIIGGGAAGFFAAISCKVYHPEAEVCIIEKTGKTLSKVKVSGGGRCNVTNVIESRADFLKNYPRGSKNLKKTFSKHFRTDTIDWFEKRGVQLKAEDDGRMFPVTDDSQTIINCLRNEVHSKGVILIQSCKVNQIEILESQFELRFDNLEVKKYDKLILATGGSPKADGMDWIKELGHDVERSVPSLFTFNIAEEADLKALMGTSVPNATVKIVGTKLMQKGPLLVTHWGMSGPAILKLSAWGARVLHEMNYQFKVQVAWSELATEEELRVIIVGEMRSKKKLSNHNPFSIPTRLWLYLLNRVGINEEKIWMELSKKEKNQLVNILVNDVYEVKGKTTFKEEFVTCGGVVNADVDFNTMQSKIVPGLYFAGEVLDVDGVTGGFNFQAAWSTGYVAGQLES